MRKYNGLMRLSRRIAVALAAVLCLWASGCAPRHTRPHAATQANPPAASPVPAKPTPEMKTADLDTQVRAGAPLRYVVKRGDTLWDIAGYYLRDPWYWPQLWDDNPDIANPHLIYPGEVLVLTRAAKGPRLRHGGTEKLSPRIREQPLDNINTIPLEAIRAFINGPRLVDAKSMADAPYAVSFIDEHLVAGQGTEVYLRGVDDTGDAAENYSLVRDNGPYTDPTTGDVLGRQAIPVGEVHIETFGDVATGRITRSAREALVGDRLLPIESGELVRNFYPHAPATPIEGRIISLFDAVFTVGRYQVVTLNVGADKGVERGHVFAIYEDGRVVSDPVQGGQVKLPQVKAGELMVFKTDPRVSYALIMSSRRPVHVKDYVRSPQG